MNNLLINEFQLNSCAYTLLTCCATVHPVVQPVVQLLNRTKVGHPYGTYTCILESMYLFSVGC